MSTQTEIKDVVIIGGGLAGLSCAILLSKAGWNTILIEKKSYPFHKVCGEYISKEAVEYIKALGLNPSELNASTISRLNISSPKGIQLKTTLDIGGIGISRFKLDETLYKLALEKSATFLLNTKVKNVEFNEDTFETTLDSGAIIHSKFVIGSYGKREMLDKKLNRSFISNRTGYMGVKYHVKGKFPIDEIGLHNFKDGYCGIVKIEDDLHCLCYLTKRSNMVGHKSIDEMEKSILFQNLEIKRIFDNATFIFKEPEVINEISFEKKDLINNHILMCGDTSGMIAPLCGNGMSMALECSFTLCKILISSKVKSTITIQERFEIEKKYVQQWNNLFSKRLMTGRSLQHLFLKNWLTEISLNVLKRIPLLTRWLIKRTHGPVRVLNNEN